MTQITKKAGLLDKAKSFASAVKADAKALPDQLHNVGAAYKNNGGLFNKGTGSTLKAVAKNKAAMTGAGGLGTAGLVGYALKGSSQEKQAALDLLIQDGLDFDTAVELIEKVAKENEPHVAERGLRVWGRGLATSAAGALGAGAVGAGLGSAIGALSRNVGPGAAIGGFLGAGIGASVGSVHGVGTSTKNQINEDRKARGVSEHAPHKGWMSTAGRPIVRATLEGTAGKVVGYIPGMIAKKPILTATGGAIGGMVGGIHGYGASVRNQVKEDRALHKKAAVDMLINDGVDFDTAVDLVNAKAEELNV